MLHTAIKDKGKVRVGRHKRWPCPRPALSVTGAHPTRKGLFVRVGVPLSGSGQPWLDHNYLGHHPWHGRLAGRASRALALQRFADFPVIPLEATKEADRFFHLALSPQSNFIFSGIWVKEGIS